MIIQDERVVMKVNDLQCAFHMPPALMPKFRRKNSKVLWDSKDDIEDRGEEIVQNLPPGAPRFAFSVDDYPACPPNWMHGSGKASSYWLPARPGCGMWLDFNYNYEHSHHVAVVVSIQGINPITGQKTNGLRLEQYRENCPVHNTPFGQNRFCEECGHEWDAQNYISTNTTPRGLFWIDGFRGGDGEVRQYVFTEETCKGVAAGIIGEDRVFAIGVAFYLSKEPKAVKPLAPEIAAYEQYKGASSWTSHNYSSGKLKGFPPSNTISPSVKITDPNDIATFKRISIPLERRNVEGAGVAAPDAISDAKLQIMAENPQLLGIPSQINVTPGMIPSTIQCSVPTDLNVPPLVMPCIDTTKDYSHVAKGGTLRDSSWANKSDNSDHPNLSNPYVPSTPAAAPPPDIKFGPGPNIDKINFGEADATNKNSRKYQRLEMLSSSGHQMVMKDGYPQDDATSLQQLADGDSNLDIFYSSQIGPDGKEYSMETGAVLDPDSFAPRKGACASPFKKTLEFAPNETSPSEIGHDLKERTPEEIESEMKKLEITAGARIKQRIFQDPEEPEFWQKEPAGFIYINYVDLATAEKIMAAGKHSRSGSYLSSLALS